MKIKLNELSAEDDGSCGIFLKPLKMPWATNVLLFELPNIFLKIIICVGFLDFVAKINLQNFMYFKKVQLDSKNKGKLQVTITNYTQLIKPMNIPPQNSSLLSIFFSC